MNAGGVPNTCKSNGSAQRTRFRSSRTRFPGSNSHVHTSNRSLPGLNQLPAFSLPFACQRDMIRYQSCVRQNDLWRTRSTLTTKQQCNPEIPEGTGRRKPEGLSPCVRQVIHALLTRPPLKRVRLDRNLVLCALPFEKLKKFEKLIDNVGEGCYTQFRC